MGGKSSKLNSRSKHANVLFLGLPGSGKTSVLNRLGGGHTVCQLVPTKGCAMVRLSMLGFKLSCFDLGAPSMWEHYYSRAHVIVFVIDSSDRSKIEKAGLQLQELLEDTRLVGVPVLILANKQDLFGSVSGTDISNALNCSQIRGRMWQIQQTSAKTSEGLHAAFDWLARTLAEKTLSNKEMKKIAFSVNKKSS